MGGQYEYEYARSVFSVEYKDGGDLFAGLFCVTIHTALTIW